MFTSTVPEYHYEPLNLEIFPGFEEKVTAFLDYIRIQGVFCNILNQDALEDFRTPDKILHISEILIQPWHTSHLKFMLHENLNFFSSEVKKYLQSDNDFDNIVESLKRCLNLCKEAKNKHDLSNSFTSETDVKFYVNIKKHFQAIPFQCFELNKSSGIDLQEHFGIRKGFYDQMIEMFTESLKWHTAKTDLSKKPYTWDSKNAELEFSELVFNLFIISQRIGIDPKEGSFAKLKKELFNLFGLNSKNYNKKVLQIQERKLNHHFVNDLAKGMEDYHAKLHSSNK